MTLDEAIKHAEERAEDLRKEGIIKQNRNNTDESVLADRCIKCAEEHEQLAEWLKELKQLREQENEDLISKSVFDQIKWERDVAISQLHDLGYELGEKPRTDGDLINRQDALKCFNVRELKFKDKKDAELMKYYLELSFNNLEKLPSVNVIENRISGDLISRQDVIDIVEFECGEWKGLARTIVKAIEQLPSAEKTAEWIDLGVTDEWFGAVGNCSNCGNNNLVWFKYCINCGAKMKGSECEELIKIKNGKLKQS